MNFSVLSAQVKCCQKLYREYQMSVHMKGLKYV